MKLLIIAVFLSYQNDFYDMKTVPKEHVFFITD